ncbi:MAG: extracellular solute-binding protein, partial [Oscillospiraceae bacterium]|nr:extracellular solute-binding protein [Oscillospiraceae bacterium]
MKTFRRLLSVIIVIVLTAVPFGACKKASPKDTFLNAGMYVETDVTPKGLSGTIYSFLLSDGTIVCYDEALKTRYESSDAGKTWRELAGPGRGTDRYAGVQNVALLSDDTLLLNIFSEGLFLVAADGTETEFAVEELEKIKAEGKQPIFTLFCALPDDRLLLSYMTGTMSMTTEEIVDDDSPVSPEGGDGSSQPPAQSQGPGPQGSAPSTQSGGGPVTQGPGTSSGPRMGGMAIGAGGTTTVLYDAASQEKLADFSGTEWSAADVGGDVLYLLDSTNRVSQYALADGKPIKSDARTLPGVENMNGFMRMMGPGSGMTPFIADDDGTLYSIDDTGLQQIGTNGEILLMLESASCSLSSPNSSVRNVYKLYEGCFLVNLSEGASNRLLRYSWDEEAALDPEKTIEIWSLEENDAVRAAINRLRVKYPDATIKYEPALSGALSAEDAVKNLNTRLLNNDGPDVIVLDGCPMDTYINEGILLDLSGKLDVSSVYDKVLDAFNRGGLYAIPAQFSIPVLVGEAEDLSGVQTLKQLVQAAVDGNDTVPMTPDQSGGPFGNLPKEERAVLGFDNFDDMFTLLWQSSLSALIEKGGINSESLLEFVSSVKALCDKYELAAEPSGGERESISMVAMAGGGRPVRIGNGIVNYMAQRSLFGAEIISGIQVLNMVFGRSAVDDTQIVLFPGLAEGAWIPSTIVGVNADSKVEDIAVDFIAALLSDAVQGASYGEGFPVTKSGFKAQFDELNDRITENGGEPLEFDFDSLVKNILAPSISEKVIADVVRQAVSRCCGNELSIEEAVAE